MKIPFLSFDSINQAIESEMLLAYSNVFQSKWYILGKYVQAFEQEYSSFNQVQHCVGLSNGLDALHLCLKVLGIGKDDEVIVPSNTYIATLLAVSYVGATPILVEPNTNSYNIDPDNIENAITSRTKAVIPVHLYGQCCSMESIMDIATKHGISVIEDNAQSQGAAFNGKLAGSFGKINATSFYPGKNLGALGDAGAITTDNAELASKIKVLRNYGSEQKYYNEVMGYNMRLDELQAAFLSVKLKFLKDWTNERQTIARWYDQALEGVGDLVLPKVAQGATHVYHLYVISTKKRDLLQSHLNKNEIGTLIHYPIPPHLQKAYNFLGYKKGDFPIAENMANSFLSLPLWPGLTEGMVSKIADTIKNLY